VEKLGGQAMVVEHAAAERHLVRVRLSHARQADIVTEQKDKEAQAAFLPLFEGSEELQRGVGTLRPLADAAAVIVAEDSDVDAATADGVLTDIGGRAVTSRKELHVAGGEAGAEGGILGGLDETASFGDTGHQAGVAEEEGAGAHGGSGGRRSGVATTALILPRGAGPAAAKRGAR